MSHQNSYDLEASWALASYDLNHRFVLSYLYEIPVGTEPPLLRQRAGRGQRADRRLAVQRHHHAAVRHAALDHRQQHRRPLRRADAAEQHRRRSAPGRAGRGSPQPLLRHHRLQPAGRLPVRQRADLLAAAARARRAQRRPVDLQELPDPLADDRAVPHRGAQRLQPRPVLGAEHQRDVVVVRRDHRPGQRAAAAAVRPEAALVRWGPATADPAPRCPGDTVFPDALFRGDPCMIPAPADVAAPPADATVTASGLASRVLEAGTGTTHPGPRSRVLVHYSGWTTDGKMFDSSVSRGEPIAFGLYQVIPGWTEGVQLMVEGEKRRFWIPEALAYGGRPGAAGRHAGLRRRADSHRVVAAANPGRAGRLSPQQRARQPDERCRGGERHRARRDEADGGERRDPEQRRATRRRATCRAPRATRTRDASIRRRCRHRRLKRRPGAGKLLVVHRSILPRDSAARRCARRGASAPARASCGWSPARRRPRRRSRVALSSAP